MCQRSHPEVRETGRSVGGPEQAHSTPADAVLQAGDGQGRFRSAVQEHPAPIPFEFDAHLDPARQSVRRRGRVPVAAVELPPGHPLEHRRVLERVRVESGLVGTDVEALVVRVRLHAKDHPRVGAPTFDTHVDLDDAVLQVRVPDHRRALEAGSPLELGHAAGQDVPPLVVERHRRELAVGPDRSRGHQHDRQASTPPSRRRHTDSPPPMVSPPGHPERPGAVPALQLHLGPLQAYRTKYDITSFGILGPWMSRDVSGSALQPGRRTWQPGAGTRHSRGPGCWCSCWPCPPPPPVARPNRRFPSCPIRRVTPFAPWRVAAGRADNRTRAQPTSSTSTVAFSSRATAAPTARPRPGGPSTPRTVCTSTTGSWTPWPATGLGSSARFAPRAPGGGPTPRP